MSDNDSQQSSSCALLPGLWHPTIRLGLEEMITEYGNTSAQYEVHTPPIAAFDWDNTCIAGDIGEGAIVQLAKETGKEIVEEYTRLCKHQSLEAGYRYCAAILGGGTTQDIYDLTHRALKALFLHLSREICPFARFEKPLMHSFIVRRWPRRRATMGWRSWAPKAISSTNLL